MIEACACTIASTGATGVFQPYPLYAVMCSASRAWWNWLRSTSMLVTKDTPKLPPRLRIGLISADASLLRFGGRPTYDTALVGMNRNGIHITCDIRVADMLQKPTSRLRLDAFSIDHETPNTAIRISHFGWISRP